MGLLSRSSDMIEIASKYERCCSSSLAMTHRMIRACDCEGRSKTINIPNYIDPSDGRIHCIVYSIMRIVEFSFNSGSGAVLRVADSYAILTHNR